MDKYPLDELVEVMDRLLGPGGCPWDREQTHASLTRYLIEEAYEVVDAIWQKDMDKLKEELGDVLLQVVFHSALARREEAFDINDVIKGVTEKMINRHPHVFGSMNLSTSS
ncbi:MAG TPA: MazG nucleotide pyrophosphohydrolase domain-containing protein [Syntrophothermus lipocalidus]|nr:MazG nucleotide pyrophosphohydrolase domain-containing protein [Syntrophothermus lipocalidus]